jgi:hypothetical protein
MQNGFGLIVRMVRQQNPIGRLVCQGLVAQPARRCFDPLTGPCGHFHSNDGYRNAKRRADLSARICPIIGVTAETVMYVERGKTQACISCMTTHGMEQNRGIEPSGKAHGDSLTRPDMAGKAGGYRLHYSIS